MIFTKFSRSLSAFLFAFLGCLGLAFTVSPKGLSLRKIDLRKQVILPADTTEKDTVEAPYQPSRKPTYTPKDRFGDPFSNTSSHSPLLMKDPASLKLDVEIDTGMNYTIYEKIGDLNYRPTSSMSFEEFKQYQEREQLKEYWKNRSAGLDGESAVSGRNLIPPIYISPIFDRIFGGTYVEIIPRGFVTLDFGGRWQRVNNPNIPIRQQRNGGFEFDQQISMNVTGKIGEKLQITANFDNNNSFDFENNLRVEYTGFEEDILQKLEIGNVSLPLNNSLITGAQNLFGVKAQLQFGDLYVTTVASTQRGKSETIEIEGGGVQGREFEILASNYDENRHFFLGHYFRDNYERWLEGVPWVTSGVNITNVEVYVVNRNNDTETLRDVVGLMDLAEPGAANIFRDDRIRPTGRASVNSNIANDLFERLPGQNSDDRNSDQVNAYLEGLGLSEGLDFEKITSARKLDFNEYTVNSELGYITLFRKLQNDEALAVSYQYSADGRPHTVGELSRDYTNLDEDKVVFLKMLRPRRISITATPAEGEPEERVPTWDLMMKNIYSLNATNISPDGFQLRVIYRDDNTGIDNPQLQEGVVTSTTPLIEVLGLDRLNPNNDPQRDGNFDFVEDVTIDTETGIIIFPFLEPFSSALRDAFRGDPREDDLIAKYAFDELYSSTLIDAQLVSNKNKFFLQGLFQSGSSNEIVIPGFNIAEGSVRVFAGGSPLTEGIDYQVDYTFGKVNIINEGVLNSGKKITISYEKADLFNFQSRTLLGARFDYHLSDDINLGATLLHLNERPLITRISVGNEPTRNTKYGFDVNIQKESRFITKMLDKLPVIQTKEPSSISFNAEFAQLIPGTSNIVDGEGTSYIDDFENTVTPFSLNNPTTWHLAATPDRRNRPDFYGPDLDLGQNFFRAKLAWYQIDNLFYRNDRRTPSGISEEELMNHYVRSVTPQEIFPGNDPNIINFQQIFDLAYYPEERGPYNYNPQVSDDGTLLTNDARQNWGGITHAIRSEVDFDKANVEYIEFWLMDPFMETRLTGNPNVVIDDGRGNNVGNTSGGDLYFNLGSISEDVIPDSQHGFENGLPPSGIDLDQQATPGVQQTEWGFVTQQPFLTNAFDNSEDSRSNQDVGLDGLNSEAEREFFRNDFEDPSADDFRYFLGDDFDATNAGILERYKNFNGMENNSPVITSANSLFTPSATTIPDNEDLNDDNTLSELEEYYEYKIDLDPDQLANNEYVVDQITERETGDEVTWYLFRVPIRQFDRQFGNISGFKSIRYLRMYLTDFEEPVVLRMANFRFISSRWRRSFSRFEEPNFDDDSDQDAVPEDFTVSVVNIEENSTGTETRSPYVLPPGFQRDRDNTSAVERRLNEQSLQVCADDLPDGEARAVIKESRLDLINYGRIKMFLHADSDAEDGEVTAFLRLGTDVDSNYYEIEIPLTITRPDATLATEIWPEENEIDLDINELYALKSERDRLQLPKAQVFPIDSAKVVGRHRIRLRGNPDLSTVEWLTIGIRNPKSRDGLPRSACIWANELRVTDFDDTRGWAANATLNAKLADFANITATVRHTTFGFGGIQSRIAERTREETTSYDISANVTLDKLLPERLGLKVPMFVSYQKTTVTPFFDPANPDITLDAALLSRSEDERDEYEDIVTDTETRRSINFINVRKVKVKEDAKKHIYDIENFSFSYSYSELVQTNFNLQRFFRQNQNGSVAYNYSPTTEPWEPFKNVKFLKGKYLQLIKDFNINPMPSNISVRWDLDRQLVQRLYRNDNNGSLENFEKFFTFNRNYNVRWDLTKNLSIDYTSRAEAIIDEPNSSPFGGFNQEPRDSTSAPPEYITQSQYQDSIWTNLRNLGRMRNFNQSIGANYRLPLDKLPVTDWLSADYRYQATYSWTAGPLYTRPEDIERLDFGNTIQNSRDNTVSGKVDLVKLYNKVGYLKKINSPPRNRRRSSLRQNQQTDTTQTRQAENKALKGVLKFLMSVRSVNATYTLREGTMLTGFTRRAYLFGMDSSFNEPGWSFILGSQDPSIRTRLAEKGLLTQNPSLTAPFTQTETEDINIRADLEPFKDFKVQLTTRKTKTSAYEEIFRYDTAGGFNDYRSFGPARSGSYNISFMTIRTAFKGDDDDNNSPVFEDFERNRLDILSRFREINPEYDTNSQDVLIPAFIAAYTGRDAQDISLNPFPNIPIPNWRVDYAGLGKIPALQEQFQSISITHAYQSSYSVTNYNSNLEYEQGLDLSNSLQDYNNSVFADPDLDLIPVYNISQVIISEQFAPLIGVNIRTKKRLTAKVEYKTQRDIALNINNAQVTEVRSNDVVLEMGFTKANFKLPFKSRGRVITLKNDLTFRMNFTIRDTETIQRRINEISTITNGALNIQLRPNVSYVLNEKLNLQFYFERNINEPRISTAFRRATTRMGLQVRFSLAQ